jgi:L-malate glycosyltransferase
MKPRVLQLIGSFHQGGSERQALSITRMLREEGTFDASIAVLNGDGVLRREAEAIVGGTIEQFPLTSFYTAGFVRQVRRFARHLRSERIDAIHTHDFYTNVFGLAAAALAGVPVRIASKRETTGMRTRMQEMVERAEFAGADRVLANSVAVRDHLRARGVAAEKICVIHNGVDVERFLPTRISRVSVCSKLGLPTARDVRFITLVANLRHRIKNIPMLLRTAASVMRAHPNVHFVIAGEGELLGELKTRAAELGVAGNVHFIGRCNDVADLLGLSTACVLTSSAEGFPNVILEYMAAAKPVVATDVGGVAEAVTDGETGYLVASDDDESLSERLASLLSDTHLATRMGAAGRRVVEKRFDSSQQLAAILWMYNERLGAKKGYARTAWYARTEIGTEQTASLVSHTVGNQ